MHTRRAPLAGALAVLAAVPVPHAAAADPFPEGSTVFAVLPDTQYYAHHYPDIFHAQTQWIAENLAPLNIAAVFHEGDITNRNTPQQWSVARDAMARVLGRVPVLMASGNHDHGPNGSADDRSTLLDQYFTPRSFFGRDTRYGTHGAGVLNHYRLFEAGGRRWIGLALEWAPRHGVVEWANEVLALHEDRLAIVVVHAYMHRGPHRLDRQVYGQTQSGSPYAYGTADDPEGTSDGGDLWRNLVSRHPNVVLVLSGHIGGTGLLSSPTPHGNVVHQMLADYQSEEEGGAGYLRLIALLPDGASLRVRTYSPWEDAWRRDGENEFGLQLITAPGHGGWICRPDVHPIGGGDGSLDVNDLLAYLGLFRAGDRRADLAPTEDGDGVVDVNDLLAFLAAFRAGCPEPAPDPLPPEPR